MSTEIMSNNVKKLEKTLEELDLTSGDLRNGVREMMENWKRATDFGVEIAVETSIRTETDYYDERFFLHTGFMELKNQHRDDFSGQYHFSTVLSDKQLREFVAEFPDLVKKALEKAKQRVGENEKALRGLENLQSAIQSVL